MGEVLTTLSPPSCVLPSSCYSQEEEKTPRGFVKNARSNNTCACLLQHLIATTSTRAQKTLRKKKREALASCPKETTHNHDQREREKKPTKKKKNLGEKINRENPFFWPYPRNCNPQQWVDRGCSRCFVGRLFLFLFIYIFPTYLLNGARSRAATRA